MIQTTRKGVYTDDGKRHKAVNLQPRSELRKPQMTVLQMIEMRDLTNGRLTNAQMEGVFAYVRNEIEREMVACKETEK